VAVSSAVRNTAVVKPPGRGAGRPCRNVRPGTKVLTEKTIRPYQSFRAAGGSENLETERGPKQTSCRAAWNCAPGSAGKWKTQVPGGRRFTKPPGCDRGGTCACAWERVKRRGGRPGRTDSATWRSGREICPPLRTGAQPATVQSLLSLHLLCLPRFGGPRSARGKGRVEPRRLREEGPFRWGGVRGGGLHH